MRLVVMVCVLVLFDLVVFMIFVMKVCKLLVCMIIGFCLVCPVVAGGVVSVGGGLVLMCMFLMWTLGEEFFVDVVGEIGVFCFVWTIFCFSVLFFCLIFVSLLCRVAFFDWSSLSRIFCWLCMLVCLMLVVVCIEEIQLVSEVQRCV